MIKNDLNDKNNEYFKDPVKKLYIMFCQYCFGSTRHEAPVFLSAILCNGAECFMYIVCVCFIVKTKVKNKIFFKKERSSTIIMGRTKKNYPESFHHAALLHNNIPCFNRMSD